ncbi:MAG: pyridoxal-dependent decarboxylase [Bacteroidota bacterium]
MMKIWQKRSQEEIKHIVFGALEENINFDKQGVLGVPASYLDDKVFNQDVTFLKDAPFITALVKNPNHIGCHTLGKSEPFFAGTHAIEKELIDICAVDILKGEEGAHDGYVASGGTEANIQAMWTYRNYYMQEFSASLDEIVMLCSEDSHYSVDKAANLLCIDIFKYQVDENSREISEETISEAIEKATSAGKKYFIVINNMMTTMFGSVDNIDILTATLLKHSCEFKLHVDGAYGGFYYPFTDQEKNPLTFQNPHINSFTLDAHKMAQAPYGTGIFLIRKGWMHYANTKQASYVEGEDFTLIGSRSGANAIATWMILVKNGPFGWYEKVLILQKRADWLCAQLAQLGIAYYRNQMSNIITIKAPYVKKEIVSKYGLVPDSHQNPKWFKIVIMEHVSLEKLSLLINDIKNERGEH